MDRIDRDKFTKKMLGMGIQVGDAYTPPCHKQPVFEKYVSNFEFKVADDILSRHVSLPMYTELTYFDIDVITSKINEVMSYYE